MLFKEEVYKIIGAAMEVHNTLGVGFTEYVYQDALAVEFKEWDIPFEKEKHLTISYKGINLPHAYFADFFCFNQIIVELKAAQSISNEHRAQILNYMKATNTRVGVLLNFGEHSLKYERFVL